MPFSGLRWGARTGSKKPIRCELSAVAVAIAIGVAVAVAVAAATAVGFLSSCCLG